MFAGIEIEDEFMDYELFRISSSHCGDCRQRFKKVIAKNKFSFTGTTEGKHRGLF
jgi:hypothetical protein